MSHIPWSVSLDQLVAGVLSMAMDNDRRVASSPALLQFANQVDAFKQDLRNLGESDFERMLPASRETPTHFKWHLFSADDNTFQVWLHEHKHSAGPGDGYAQSIHNHRYDLTTLILAGGYRHSQFLMDVSDDLKVTDLRQASALNLRPGDNYSLTPDDYHSISQVREGTLSLVIQWSSSKLYSVSVNLITRKAVAHYPVEARFDILRSVFR